LKVASPFFGSGLLNLYRSSFIKRFVEWTAGRCTGVVKAIVFSVLVRNFNTTCSGALSSLKDTGDSCGAVERTCDNPDQSLEATIVAVWLLVAFFVTVLYPVYGALFLLLRRVIGYRLGSGAEEELNEKNGFTGQEKRPIKKSTHKGSRKK